MSKRKLKLAKVNSYALFRGKLLPRDEVLELEMQAREARGESQGAIDSNVVQENLSGSDDGLTADEQALEDKIEAEMLAKAEKVEKAIADHDAPKPAPKKSGAKKSAKKSAPKKAVAKSDDNSTDNAFTVES